MRFVFENGGRTGCLTCEALADYMEGFIWHTPQQPMSIEPGKTHIFAAGDMRVDFSPGANGPGELFREAGRLRVQLIAANARSDDTGGELRQLAASYWAEGEAMEIARAVPLGRPGLGKSTL